MESSQLCTSNAGRRAAKGAAKLSGPDEKVNADEISLSTVVFCLFCSDVIDHALTDVLLGFLVVIYSVIDFKGWMCLRDCHLVSP